jgi:hypothetical protein
MLLLTVRPLRVLPPGLQSLADCQAIGDGAEKSAALVQLAQLEGASESSVSSSTRTRQGGSCLRDIL